MDNTIDLLEIKIENAKKKLPEETVNAIAAVDWKAAILGLRAKKGYTFEQLGDLELETELVLCGLSSPSQYQKELGEQMKISSREAAELVNEMNDLVFKRIREEIIKNAERKKIFINRPPVIKTVKDPGSIGMPSTRTVNGTIPEKVVPKGSEEKANTAILNSAGIEIIPARLDNTNNPGGPAHSASSTPDVGGDKEKTILPVLEENHLPLVPKLLTSLKTPVVKTEHTLDNLSKASPSSYPPKADPYRLSPGE